MQTDLEVRISPLEQSHHSAFSQALRACGVFSTAEVACCEELFEISMTPKGKTEYQFYGAFLENEPRGFLGIGQDTLADRAMELYWIFVDPRDARKGLGTSLMSFFDRESQRRKSRLATIWTSSLPGYQPACRLYERHGFLLTCRLPNYYKVGDDLLIYRKDYV